MIYFKPYYDIADDSSDWKRSSKMLSVEHFWCVCVCNSKNNSSSSIDDSSGVYLAPSAALASGASITMQR